MPWAAAGRCSSSEAVAQLDATTAASLFPQSRAPDAALAGLYLYFSCFDRSHSISQSIHSLDGAFWHGILHRQEPDADNARYWFRQIPTHPIFAELARSALEIEARFPGLSSAASSEVGRETRWDPIRFIGLCDRAGREPGAPLEQMALEIQRAEWQLLFDYCAGSRSREL